MHERRPSRKYSDRVRANRGSKNLYHDIDMIVTTEKRNSEIKSLLRWSCLNMGLSLYVLFIIFIYWNQWELGSATCISHLSVFIIIFGYVQFF